MLQDDMVSFARSNRKAADRFRFAGEAISQAPVLSVDPVIRHLQLALFFYSMDIYDANLASLRNFNPHCR